MLSLASGSYPSASARASAIEAAIFAAFDQSPRVIPYIQVHEFEALLFSDLDAFENATGHSGASLALREDIPPEEVNGTRPPSKRILSSYPNYDKVNDGTLAAEAIGVPAMRSACPRFDAWLANLGL